MVERNQLGQYSTPWALAKAIVEQGLELLEEREVTFLDPAFGTGAFFSALLATLDRSSSCKLKQARGIEIDPHYGEPSRTLWRDFPIDVELRDFTSLEPNSQYNLVVCNPPYIRHHHLDSTAKRRLGETVLNRLGLKLSGLSGMYCYFLLFCDAWLSNGGIGCWLIPSEFMDVNYGVQIKRYLRDKVELVQIHRFCSTDLQFDDALVTSAVVFFRKQSPSNYHKVRLTFGGSIAKPDKILSLPQKGLDPKEKWNNFFAARKKKSSEPKFRLGDFFSIKRGIATGKNSFFILNEKDAQSLELPSELLRPILPSPRALQSDIIACKPNGAPDLESPLFLLDCSLPEEIIRSDYPLLWSYLKDGEGTVSQGYLCKKRSPWYKQESRTAAPVLCTYMGRTGPQTKNPFKFILNASNAIMTNVYLGLYPKHELELSTQVAQELYRKVWVHLKNLDPESLIGEGRVYGGGLHKLEPKELAQVPIPAEIKELMPATQKQLVLF